MFIVITSYIAVSFEKSSLIMRHFITKELTAHQHQSLKTHSLFHTSYKLQVAQHSNLQLLILPWKLLNWINRNKVTVIHVNFSNASSHLTYARFTKSHISHLSWEETKAPANMNIHTHNHRPTSPHTGLAETNSSFCLGQIGTKELLIERYQTGVRAHCWL